VTTDLAASAVPGVTTPVVEVRHLCKNFYRSGAGGRLVALDDVSFQVARGEVLGVVGESGSGKTTLARCIAGLTRPSAGTITVGNLEWSESLSGRERHTLSRQLQLVFQDPYASLNPRMKVSDLVAEGMLVHKLCQSRQGARVAALALIERVGLRPELAGRYPRELSGGQRQRVAIARALAVRPGVLVLDEPVSSLDLSIQAQVLNLIRDLIAAGDQSVLFIAHDLAVIRFVCDSVVVMQDGSIVERGSVGDVLGNPQHPFTRELLASVAGDRGSRP
jgi:oligopeptide transport system ATP-binding protein